MPKAAVGKALSPVSVQSKSVAAGDGTGILLQSLGTRLFSFIGIHISIFFLTVILFGPGKVMYS